MAVGREPFDQAARAQAATEAHRVLNAAASARESYWHDADAWAAWEKAVEIFHAAVRAAYPPGFWEDVARLRAGDPAGLETAVAFLEQDPWFFGSGYVKADLLRYLKRFDLPPPYDDRLRRVILAAVDRPLRREFRHYCRLARKL